MRLHRLRGGAIGELWVIRGSHELCGGCGCMGVACGECIVAVRAMVRCR